MNHLPNLFEITEASQPRHAPSPTTTQASLVTDEEETRVRNFLKTKPIGRWVGVDGDKSVNKAHGVTGIPRTVIVDQQGHIADVTCPRAVTEQRLNDLLAGKKIASVERRKEDHFRSGELPGLRGLSEGQHV